jgi:hypothetical protein
MAGRGIVATPAEPRLARAAADHRWPGVMPGAAFRLGDGLGDHRHARKRMIYASYFGKSCASE